MNFVLFFVLLQCNIQIITMEIYTPRELLDLHKSYNKNGAAVVKYSNDTELCELAWNMLYRPEIPYVFFNCDPYYQQMKNEPLSEFCPGFDCWESQLSVVSRIEILEIMNKYREKVAKGTCRNWCKKNKHRLVFELQWNYYLENATISLLKKCMRMKRGARIYFSVTGEYAEEEAKNETKSDEKYESVRNQSADILTMITDSSMVDFNENYYLYMHMNSQKISDAFFEQIVTSFKMKTGLQSELRSELWKLMYKNHLNDWDKESQFRRGDMHDVACAFICRRGVDFVTALNETVKDGIVGHFACSFLTGLVSNTTENSIKPVVNLPKPPKIVFPINTAKNPSDINCFLADERAWFGSEYSYYPTLCKRNGSVDIYSNLLYERCNYYTPQNDPEICSGSQYSPITWSEKFYGLTMKHTLIDYDEKIKFVETEECNVPLQQLPQPQKYGPNILNYICTLQEIVWVQANTNNCSGWNCADSQLTEATKKNIVDSLNIARNKIARGECSEECHQPCKDCDTNVRYCNMVAVQWHWFLEKKASDIVKNCPTNYSFRSGLIYDDEPFPEMHEISYEEVTLIFDLPYDEGQLALPKTFMKLFWMNAFQDWTDYHYFRRGNTQYIGCSIISRPYAAKTPKIKPKMNFYNGMPTHMVCIYATLNGSFVSLLGEADFDCCPVCVEYFFGLPCWLNYKKGNNSFKSLCNSTLLITELTVNCQAKKRCNDDSISKAWYIQYEGLTLVQYLNGSLIPINRTAFNSIGALYQKKYCKYLVLFFLLQIPLWLLMIIYISSIVNIRVKELLKKTPPLSFVIRLIEHSTKAPQEEISEKKQSEGKKKILDDITERTKEIPSYSDREHATKRATTKKPTKTLEIRTASTTTREPFTSPIAQKTPIRETRDEDEDLAEEEEYEYATGPTITIHIGLPAGGARRGVTRRPAKERKAPRRAKTTTEPPFSKKSVRKKN